MIVTLGPMFGPENAPSGWSDSWLSVSPTEKSRWEKTKEFEKKYNLFLETFKKDALERLFFVYTKL